MAVIEDDHVLHTPNVVLFPWLVMIIGCCVHYVITRWKIKVPYTCVIFVVGAVMGYCSTESILGGHNAVNESSKMWINIDGEVLLLIFLPPLLFLDSYNADVYLFKKSFSQLLVFAFPMSLGGTILTALVAYFVLPYNWSNDLCLLVGSILAATDPVAVSVLLRELGAPPRLQAHISGESLLNDGAAVVFFNIFRARFLHEMGIVGRGEEIGWLHGIVLFMRLSLGGAAIGLVFGIMLVGILFNLNRRLSKEESVFQVTTTIAVAYLSYFVSEVILHCSGILAVVFCGLVTKSFGETLFNDTHLTHDFIEIFECLLNSTLFTLGGAVWASVIPYFSGLDWLYLFILYVAVIIIRFVLMISCYPLTSRIGVGQSIHEMIFQSWGGLRGAVGIALALLLKKEVLGYSEDENLSEEMRVQYQQTVQKLFGMIGGITFLSLVVAGPTSGPLLRVLGLVKPSKARSSVIGKHKKHLVKHILAEFVNLISEKRFEHLDYGLIQMKVSILGEVSPDIFYSAIELFKKRYPGKTLPNLENVTKHIDSTALEYLNELDFGTVKTNHPRETVYCFRDIPDELALIEERNLFIECVEIEYHNQLQSGELDSRSSIAWSLLHSVRCAKDSAANGEAMNDWSALEKINLIRFDRALHAYRVGALFNRRRGDDDYNTIRTKVLQSLSFIKAHTSSQEIFKARLASVEKRSLSMTEKRVIDESREQVARAEALIAAFDEHDVNAIKSQYACQLLLHKCAIYVEDLAHKGLVTEREASVFLDGFGLELNKLRLSSELGAQVSSSSHLDSMT